ncbi:hypothetical protein ACFYOT_08595 [Saccharothrix saharensis]|uniref:hypothetical protein n=1 Tax=Saccharothrix saharensis TaxID=571190 RepID=UPI0036AC0FB8
MSGDFPEQDRRGLAEWLHDCAVPEQRDVPAQRDVLGQRDVPDRCGGPAYAVSFGWFPAHLPPPVPEQLIPTPRRAPDDLR